MNEERLHGLYQYRKAQRCPAGLFSETQVYRSNAFDAFDTIYKTVIEGPLSDVEIWNLLSAFFQTMHAVARYSHHLTPPPGTFVCRTYQSNLFDEKNFEKHAFRCRAESKKAVADQRFTSELDAVLQNPCSWKPYASLLPCCSRFW